MTKILTHLLIEFATIVFIVLFTLKMANVITISWWWVFSPLWISFGLIFAIMLFLLILIKVLD